MSHVLRRIELNDSIVEGLTHIPFFRSQSYVDGKTGNVVTYNTVITSPVKYFTASPSSDCLFAFGTSLALVVRNGVGSKIDFKNCVRWVICNAAHTRLVTLDIDWNVTLYNAVDGGFVQELVARMPMRYHVSTPGKRQILAAPLNQF